VNRPTMATGGEADAAGPVSMQEGGRRRRITAHSFPLLLHPRAADAGEV
jgi:hypothetical protein